MATSAVCIGRGSSPAITAQRNGVTKRSSSQPTSSCSCWTRRALDLGEPRGCRSRARPPDKSLGDRLAEHRRLRSSARRADETSRIRSAVPRQPHEPCRPRHARQALWIVPRAIPRLFAYGGLATPASDRQRGRPCGSSTRRLIPQPVVCDATRPASADRALSRLQPLRRTSRPRCSARSPR